ncbi:MAG: glycine cleavage system protein GcvH [Anaerolineales bacterium]|nr:glycine cleavage system protein GcvH [Anaerolineales bacterium]HEY61149.1 glycine cleavage system protein GcvH [Anaerolineae bacterium]
MKVPDDLKFTKNDEWIRVDGEIGTIGITDYAQDSLSDIVFIEFLVDKGDTINKGEACASVESVKAAADVYMPASGEIIEINESLTDTPDLINSDPFGEAWMVKVKLSNPSEIDELLDPNAYKTMEHEH